MQHLPANMAASFSLHHDQLVTSANPGNPQLGDVRVSWSAVPLQTVTILARLDGNQLVPAENAANDQGYQIQVGERSLQDLLPDVPTSPPLIWVRRVLSLVLAGLGVLLLFRQHAPVRRDGLLALALGVLGVGVVAGVLWLGIDGRTGICWFALAAVGLALSLWRLRRV